jgi:hypothetical protein
MRALCMLSIRLLLSSGCWLRGHQDSVNHMDDGLHSMKHTHSSDHNSDKTFKS